MKGAPNLWANCWSLLSINSRSRPSFRPPALLIERAARLLLHCLAETNCCPSAAALTINKSEHSSSLCQSQFSTNNSKANTRGRRATSSKKRSLGRNLLPPVEYRCKVRCLQEQPANTSDLPSLFAFCSSTTASTSFIGNSAVFVKWPAHAAADEQRGGD